ncbi:MAG: FAD-linked oxidase C-terminal domain-containing protein [Planctomycetota bacterium]|nr:FAD-linked oxidase C-terminal domain-containing protein [Planctomycetota bacterium]
MELPVLRTQPGAANLERALTNAIAGEVRFDQHDRMLYATDASLYQVEPLGVVIPASTDDAVEAVRVCAARGVPILPRGGGTSLAGQCTNRAVVIDFSPRCARVLEVDAPARRVRVEPGITVDDLNDALAARGGEDASLFFAPDPATSRHANIGGCIGNNAAGARSVRYGRTSESLLGVDVCLADGTRLTLDEGAASRDPRVARLTRAVCEIVARHHAQIRERFPRTIRRNAGYALDMILDQMQRAGWSPGGAIDERVCAGVNLAHLVCGSEGTLCVTLGASLRLHPRPRAKGLMVLGFPGVDEAIERVPAILTTAPSAVELLDDMVVDLARANAEYRRYVDLMPQPVEGPLKGVLYVEFFADSADDVRERFAAVRRLCPGVAAQEHVDAGAMLNAWKLRKAGEPLLHGIPGHRKPITFIEDNAVPVERLGEFVRSLREIVTRHGTIAAYYAHASVGVLHVRPLIDLHDPHDRVRMKAIALEAADLARSLGGVMSGEHGDGRIRSPFLERHFGHDLMGAFRDVKRLFDPANLLNPGNIVDIAGDSPRPLESITWNLRADLSSPEPGPRRPEVDWGGVETYFDYADQHGFDGAVEMCNGAGVCRKKQGGTMCPSYMATLDERHSTRGRGNALRLAITGQFEQSPGEAAPRAGRPRPAWNDPGTNETLRLCLSCKACKTECPSNVDIARLKAEYAAQQYRETGAPLAHRIMGEIRTLNRLGALAPRIANFGAAFGPARALADIVLGLDPRRSLPRFARSLAARWDEEHAARAQAGLADGSPPPGAPRVALFGDCFTMFNEPGIGLATRRVLEACGYEVVLADAGCCGRAKISLGLLPQAIDEIDATIERLAPVAADPRVVAILVAEPSCLSAIKDDWLALKVRAERTTRATIAAKAFLPEDFVESRWTSHPRAPAFRRPTADVLLHAHCHQKALWGANTSAALLRRVAPGRLTVLDTGCCGMAGSFGYTRDRFDLSQKIGELALFPALRGAPDAIACATGTSCRHQVHDALHRDALHPIEVAAALLETPA